MMNLVYAVCGTAFFLMFAIVVAMHGSGTTLAFLAAALFSAGASQYFAQGGTQYTYIAALSCAAASLLLAAITLVLFSSGVTT